jgi:SAM-dependent methyltransferase
MKDIVRDTDEDWRLLGDGDPYWAVCTDEAYRAGAMTAEARERFFESGSSYVVTNHSLLKRHFNAPDRFGAVLDFGCGVGRLLIPWSRVADRAVGVDVSPGMLALSASNAAEAGRDNVQTAASLDEAAPQGPFDTNRP